MDNIFEYIIPITFAALYLLNLTLKVGKSSKEQTEGTDVDERQRRIQEEIRRKISQRTGGSSQPSSSGSFSQEDVSVSEPQPEPELFTSPRDTFASQLQARLERVEATKKQAQELQKLGANNIATNSRPDTRSRTRGLFSGSVRTTLRDPVAARAAFIYAEVLGTPVSQKKASSVPGFS